ncbi:hypothetical protein K466DRAFT_295941 [Polyporus arcularius HHB13444]|uniref:Uncharacterized protein n=1 Tax=Polyporus arcularius HHB13444 TaxID=1314778 RepID=A0A5C3NYV1_9APHY|nr:hypothetical protein K466DRAFT_295941 [Polyporus arcularius HHB13444]
MAPHVSDSAEDLTRTEPGDMLQRICISLNWNHGQDIAKSQVLIHRRRRDRGERCLRRTEDAAVSLMHKLEHAWRVRTRLEFPVYPPRRPWLKLPPSPRIPFPATLSPSALIPLFLLLAVLKSKDDDVLHCDMSSPDAECMTDVHEATSGVSALVAHPRRVPQSCPFMPGRRARKWQVQEN